MMIELALQALRGNATAVSSIDQVMRPSRRVFVVQIVERDFTISGGERGFLQRRHRVLQDYAFGLRPQRWVDLALARGTFGHEPMSAENNFPDELC